MDQVAWIITSATHVLYGSRSWIPNADAFCCQSLQ